MSSDRDLDVVVLGASGFVGRLVAGYLADHAPEGVRIGLAGRSRERLAGVRARLGAAAAAWPLLVADVTDPASLAALARAARVVATTAGPYRPHGLALVEACATAGTDYADLAGEVLFMRESIDRYHDVAAATGTRIVHCCGVDSIPSDLGVLLLHDAARTDGAGDLEDTTLVVTAFKGGMSGGTLASGKGQLDEVRASAAARKVVADPYALSPDRAAEPRARRRARPGVDHARRRSGELGRPVPDGGHQHPRRAPQQRPAGLGLRPQVPLPRGHRLRRRPAGAVKGAAVTAALAGVTAGLGFGPARALLDRVLPQPGQGPSEKTRRAGLFRIEIHTRTSAGVRYIATAAARGDPGYQATSVMLGESALCLALDRDRLPDRAGVLTPATAMGAALAGRLRAAGHTLAVQRTGH